MYRASRARKEKIDDAFTRVTGDAPSSASPGQPMAHTRVFGGCDTQFKALRREEKQRVT